MDKNNRPIEDIFNECCEKMLGGMSVDEVIRQHPNNAKELRELLSVVQNVKDVPPLEISDQKVISCLIKVGEAIQRQKENACAYWIFSFVIYTFWFLQFVLGFVFWFLPLYLPLYSSHT